MIYMETNREKIKEFVEEVNTRVKETSNGKFMHLVGIKLGNKGWVNYADFSEEDTPTNNALDVYEKSLSAKENGNMLSVELVTNDKGYTNVVSVHPAETSEEEKKSNDPTKKYDYGMAVKVAGQVIAAKLSKPESSFSDELLVSDFEKYIKLFYRSIRGVRENTGEDF